jgi:signal transduction histidine kinase
MPIRADVAQLRSAVANLIRNALMYSPSTTPVEVVVDADRVRARVTVRDRGPGIPSEERSRIFDPFVRGAVGRDVARGNGLGLFVVRRVAEAHGGSVRLDRTSGGARFCLQLPIPREDLRASAS